jgi:hypothetical protein
LRSAAVVGQSPGQELIQHDSQSEHVCRHRHAAAQNLLRRGVGRREHAPAEARELHLAFLLPHEFGDAEIQKLHLAIGRHQDVRGLQIAMHDEAAVRRVGGVAAGGEEPEPILQRQAASAAIIGNRLSFHSLHHEVGPPVRGLAGIEKPRDAGMLQARQDPPLARKTTQNLDGIHAALDELHRDFLFEPSVGALAEIDLAHAAAAEWLDQAVDPHRLAAPVGDEPFFGFGFIIGARTAMKVGEAGQQSE